MEEQQAGEGSSRALFGLIDAQFHLRGPFRAGDPLVPDADGGVLLEVFQLLGVAAGHEVLQVVEVEARGGVVPGLQLGVDARAQIRHVGHLLRSNDGTVDENFNLHSS